MIYYYMSGALMMSCFVSGMFFLKFWKKTSDKLFLYFSWSFFLLTAERILLGFLGSAQEPKPQVYLFRLAAFLLIIFAIVQKNQNSKRT